jgi:hypothetical protein
LTSEQISNNENKDQASTTTDSTNYTEYDIISKKMKDKPPISEGGDDQQKVGEQNLAYLSYQGRGGVQHQEEEKITIDYMAKDFASFRNALLDLIPRKIPQWEDKSEADLGIMLIELFSYIADELSYFQDRVANEAFLRTARARGSVTNHLRLIDYYMQKGLSANAFIKVEVKQSAIIPAGFQISTYPERRGGGRREESSDIIIFETLRDQLVDVAYESIPVNAKNDNNNYDNSNNNSNSTGMNPSAILQGSFPERKKGQHILLFEEDSQDKIIVREAIVKLAEDSRITDDGSNNTLITWEKGNEYPKVAYGQKATNVFCCANIIKASHGRTIRSEKLKLEDQKVSRFSFTLREGPLTFILDASNSTEPRGALKVWVDGELWEETDSLLKCGPLDQKFSISIDEDGYPTILFGDGNFGLKPEDDSLIEAEYRVGIGSVGNVGKDTLTQFDLPQNPHWIVEEVIESVTNPLPATGGIDRESIDDARIAGPKSLGTLQRAVTLRDYEDLVKREFKNEITNAKARFVYTGSWDTIFVSVDVMGGRKNIVEGAYYDEHDPSLPNRIRKYLDRVKMIGYEVQVEAAKYVPIEIGITVCLQKHLDSQIVRKRILSSLTNKDNIVDGTKGLFHPDNFTFGDSVYASKIYEILKKTPEVKYGIITTFRKRQGDETMNSINMVKPSIGDGSPSPYSSDIACSEKSIALRDKETKRNLELGYISISEDEIITINTDPQHPEKGLLVVNFVGDDNRIEDHVGEDEHDFYSYPLSDENSMW